MKRTLALLALFFGAVPLAAAAAPTQISVTGTGTVTAIPDQATVNATLTTTADSAVEATEQNNRTYDAILRAVAQAGVARDDISLSYYNVSYVPKPSPPATAQRDERYGYTVNRSFDVKVRKMSQAGAVVDALTRAGATKVGGVSFDVAETHALRAQAMQRAMTDARAQADALARAAGLHVTQIVSISTAPRGTVVPMFKTMAAAAPAPTQFDPGSVNVTTDVTVIFAATP